ncbi:MAG: hypothetical protein R3F55_22410 [Alphaproteobacteria bacterium]
MSWDDIRTKFRECASVAARPLSPARVDQALDIAGRLESLANATDLIRCLG